MLEVFKILGCVVKKFTGCSTQIYFWLSLFGNHKICMCLESEGSLWSMCLPCREAICLRYGSIFWTYEETMQYYFYCASSSFFWAGMAHTHTHFMVHMRCLHVQNMFKKVFENKSLSTVMLAFHGLPQMDTMYLMQEHWKQDKLLCFCSPCLTYTRLYSWMQFKSIHFSDILDCFWRFGNFEIVFCLCCFQ